MLEAHGRQDRLGRLGVGDLLDDTLGEREDPHALTWPARSVSAVNRRRVERRGVDVDGLELDTTVESGLDEVGSLEDADALAPAQ